MDYAIHWKRLLSQNRNIQGGALLSPDGALITCTSFAGSVEQEIMTAHCAAIAALAHQLIEDSGHGELDVAIIEGELGYVVLMPILDKAIFAVLASKQAKLGLVLLDMRRLTDDGSFGPGMAADPIFPPQPSKYSTAHARPEQD